MHLTRFTDYALRAMGYLALEPEKRSTVGTVAKRMGMSEDHLLKVVQRLSQAGLVKTIRGRKGGVRLARRPDEIFIGEVVRKTEDNLRIVPCFDDANKSCPITAACGISPMMEQALGAFLSTLDRYTIADMIVHREELLQLTLGNRREGQEVPEQAMA
ncbi:MAG: Rrf2 family transcriptional regulator [Gemmatimonadaceae bacterium]